MTSTSPFVTTPDGTATLVTLYVQPRASRTEVSGLHDSALRLRVTAPPVDGEANAEIVVFLAKQLGIAKSAIQIISGDAARRKRVRIEGMTPENVERILIP